MGLVGVDTSFANKKVKMGEAGNEMSLSLTVEAVVREEGIDVEPSVGSVSLV